MKNKLKLLKCISLSIIFICIGWIFEFLGKPYRVLYGFSFQDYFMGCIGIFFVCLGGFGIPLIYYGFNEDKK